MDNETPSSDVPPDTGDIGNDPLQADLNIQYDGVRHQYTYIILCAFIVWFILPGLAFLYGGLGHRRSALTMLLQSFLVTAVITFQWMFWGFSLTYAADAGPIIGDMSHFGMMGVLAEPSNANPDLPNIVFCFYQLLFCACTVMIVVGGAFERGRIIPCLFFGFWWATIVYCPLAYWTWNANGWLYNLPSLDFAGGGPVHIASGWAALAYALVLGKRKNAAREYHNEPHNVTMVFLGTAMIWVGWFGFNGGSSLNASLRSMLVVFNTNTAAGCGVLGWVLVDFIRHRGRFSLVGACEGAIAGLVGITPAAGFVSAWFAALIGLVTGVVCASLFNLNKWLRIDEGMHVFKLHGVGGMVGAFLTGLFGTRSVAALGGGAGDEYPALGAIDGNGIQVALQLADIAAVSAWAFVVSFLLLHLINRIPGLHLRVSEDAERAGLDPELFCDEEDVGDWSIVHQFGHLATRGKLTHGVDPRQGNIEKTSQEVSTTSTSSPSSAKNA